jgi:hypothetical protein
MDITRIIPTPARPMATTVRSGFQVGCSSVPGLGTTGAGDMTDIGVAAMDAKVGVMAEEGNMHVAVMTMAMHARVTDTDTPVIMLTAATPTVVGNFVADTGNSSLRP